jgi:hypothetical protein
MSSSTASGWVSAIRASGRRSRMRLLDAIALELQDHAQAVADRRVVVHDQNHSLPIVAACHGRGCYRTKEERPVANDRPCDWKVAARAATMGGRSRHRRDHGSAGAASPRPLGQGTRTMAKKPFTTFGSRGSKRRK